jgi:hypothetical protein
MGVFGEVAKAILRAPLQISQIAPLERIIF